MHFCVLDFGEIPTAVLWISYNSKQTKYRENLLKFGDMKDRIIFADSCRNEEHIRRGLLVDLFLDPWICNGHTTTLDAL